MSLRGALLPGSQLYFCSQKECHCQPHGLAIWVLSTLPVATPPLDKIHQSAINHFTIYDTPLPLIVQPRVKTMRYDNYYSCMRRISYGNNAVQCDSAKPVTKPLAHSSQSPNLLPIPVNHQNSCRLQSITNLLQFQSITKLPANSSQSPNLFLTPVNHQTTCWFQSITQPHANSRQSPKLLPTPVSHPTFAVISADHQTCQHGKS